jgi:alpha-galactosidase
VTIADVNQCLTYGLSSWLPFQGTSSGGFWDPYSARSCFVTSLSFGPSAKPALLREAVLESRQIAPIILNGDYYPLTPYSLSNDVWMAWQFGRPDIGDGCIQAYRREQCDQSSKTVQLSGLDATATYEVRNLDVAGAIRMSGRELMDNGLKIEITNSPAAAIVIYRLVK